MSTPAHFAAIDLGAESGRVVLGSFENGRLQLSEVNRFANGPVWTLDELHWDVLRLWSEMKTGIAEACQKVGDLQGIGIDTWGVDFGLFDRAGGLIGNPFHYRDARTNGILDKAFEIVPKAEIFTETGIQFMQFNTVFQLLAMKLAGAPALDQARSLLLMPDLFNYWFTGRACCEFTNATTTQAFNPREGTWASNLLNRLGLPTGIFGEIIPPGTVVGTLRQDIQDELRVGAIPVIAPATHDTGSAVAAVPVTGDRSWAFLSSGTWSLMGMEVPRPIITEQSHAYNFTNEGGVENTYRFLKNIMGLWLVQECRRTWQREGRDYSYAEMTDMAAKARPFQAILDPDDNSFMAPGDMPPRIDAFLKKTGQPPLKQPGDYVRVCLESLALAYRQTLERIEACTGTHAEVIHVVGGGIQNRVLCQWTADATGRTVITGPVEATAAGNLAMQAVAAGALGSIAEARQVIRDSFDAEIEVYQPENKVEWDVVYPKFEQLRT